MGAFSRYFTINLAPQCRALKIEKLKAPLFPGREGAAHTIGWCIKSLATALQFMEVVSTTFGLLVHRYLPDTPPPFHWTAIPLRFEILARMSRIVVETARAQ